MAQLGHLQTSTGYLRIGLDLRIPTVPKNPDFRFRIGRKLRKTEKNGKIGKLHVTYQIKAYGTLVHADTLKFQNFSKILKTKTLKILHLHYIAESHAADRPLPGESFKSLYHHLY